MIQIFHLRHNKGQPYTLTSSQKGRGIGVLTSHYSKDIFGKLRLIHYPKVVERKDPGPYPRRIYDYSHLLYCGASRLRRRCRKKTVWRRWRGGNIKFATPEENIMSITSFAILERVLSHLPHLKTSMAEEYSLFEMFTMLCRISMTLFELNICEVLSFERSLKKMKPST